MSKILKMNEALIRQIDIAKIKNHDLISKGTGIDKSTVSLHLSSKRRINIEQAYKYAEFLKVPVIKVIDENVVKYRVVRYVSISGEVNPPTEDDFEIIVCPNQIEKKEEKIIYDKKKNTAYWYSPNFDYNNSNIENEYCYIKNKFKSYLGTITKHNKKTNMITFFNFHTQKEMKVKSEIGHPITSITFCNFTTDKKINNSL